MNNSSLNSTANRRISRIGAMLLSYGYLWIIPVVAGVVLSAVYVMYLRSETWSARQSLIVRDDLLGQSYKPGRFDSTDSLKSAQETILEIARKPQVIRNALQKLGPEPAGLFNPEADKASWPSEKVIESVQGSIALSAPNGAEFGRTEVIILNTKASSRERSRKFISLLLNEIIDKTDEVRALRLKSMAAELTQNREAAVIALEQSKDKLREMDRKLGPDVDAMNALNDEQGSESPLKREISQIRIEARVVQSDVETASSVLEMLISARNNPRELVNISSDLIKHQPTLELLKRELVEAQGTLSKSKGLYTDAHPLVISGKTEVEEIQRFIFLELNNTINGMSNDVEVLEQRAQRLDQEIQHLEARLVNLGENRVDFSTMMSEVKQRSEIVNKTQRELAEIQGLASSENANLLTPVDEPQVSTRPDEMGKKATVLAGALGGLMLGLGLVMLVAPPIDPAGPVSQATVQAVDTQQSPPPSPEPSVTETSSSKLVGDSESANTATRQKDLEQPKKGTIQNVPEKNFPVEQVPGPSATVPRVPQNISPPLRPIAKPNPGGNPSNDVASTQDTTLPVKKSVAEKPLVPPQMPATAQASSPESSVDQAFEWPIDVDSNSTNQPRPPVPRQETQTVTLEDMEESSPGTPSTPKVASDQTLSRPAIVVNRSLPSTDLKRRQPNVRPVDLAKSVESEIQDSASVAKDPTTNGDPKSKSAPNIGPETASNPPDKWPSNPFLRDRNPPTSGKSDRQTPKPGNSDETDIPVPDQIKKLSETIANFAKPVVKPPSNDPKNTSF